MKQVVIEMSDDAYEAIIGSGYVVSDFNMVSAIRNGTVLPDHECLIVYHPQGEDNKITILDSKKEGE